MTDQLWHNAVQDFIFLSSRLFSSHVTFNTALPLRIEERSKFVIAGHRKVKSLIRTMCREHSVYFFTSLLVDINPRCDLRCLLSGKWGAYLWGHCVGWPGMKSPGHEKYCSSGHVGRNTEDRTVKMWSRITQSAETPRWLLFHLSHRVRLRLRWYSWTLLTNRTLVHAKGESEFSVRERLDHLVED